MSRATEPERITHVVAEDEDGVRLDRVLADLPDMPSRAFIARLIDDGHVNVEGRPATKGRAVRAGERVVVSLPPPSPTNLVPERADLDVRFEDDHLIIVSKPPGLVVHPAVGHASGTLVHRLLGHDASFGRMGGAQRPGIVHRLDKDTSGLMMVAKDEATQATLAAELKAHTIDRRYLALVHGLVGPDTGLVDAPLGRDARDRMRMAVTDRTGSRTAQTAFRTLERFETRPGDDGYSLLECRLHTGRTHQVRVHLAYIRHPVVGDQVYGRRRGGAELGLARQFLHAWRLELVHPVTRAALVVTDPLPSELGAVLAGLEVRAPAVTAAGRDVLARLATAPTVDVP